MSWWDEKKEDNKIEEGGWLDLEIDLDTEDR